MRLPLASLTIAAPDASTLEPFVSLILDEVNVRDVVLTDDVESVGEWVLALIPSVLGPRVGADVQRLIKAVKAGTWERDTDGVVRVDGRVLADDEFTLRLVPADETTSRAVGGGGLITLDLTSSPELEAEGTARDDHEGVVLAELGVPARSVGLLHQGVVDAAILCDGPEADGPRATSLRAIRDLRLEACKPKPLVRGEQHPPWDTWRSAPWRPSNE